MEETQVAEIQAELALAAGLPSSANYFSAITELMHKVADSNRDRVRDAGLLVANTVMRGGMLQTFGTGHSEALAMELVDRAGGLVPTNRLSLRDPVLFGLKPPSYLEDRTLERKARTAQQIFDLANPGGEDLFIIASNSGVNGCIVEMALLARQQGLKVIAFTSLRHSLAVEPLHQSGKRLCDLADVVLDNGAPKGDALLPLPNGGAACGSSSITSAMLAQMMIAESLSILMERGVEPPVYLSANVPGGDTRNQAVEARYADRLRRIV